MDYFAYYKAKKEQETFVFQGEEYPIRTMVKLTKEGRKELKTNKKYAQLFWHAIYPGHLSWGYIVDWDRPTKGEWVPRKECTNKSPDEIIEEIVQAAPLLDEDHEVQNKREASYWHADIIWQGIKAMCWIFASLIFNDWVLRLFICICAAVYYGFKSEQLHNQHFVRSFNTVEFLYGIDLDLILAYYFNPSVYVPYEVDNN